MGETLGQSGEENTMNQKHVCIGVMRSNVTDAVEFLNSKIAEVLEYNNGEFPNSSIAFNQLILLPGEGGFGTVIASAAITMWK
jgi:hypothetical protein